jgi:hypothetical protein
MEHVIEPQQIRTDRSLRAFIKLHPAHVAATLIRSPRSREVHQNTPHNLATNRQKMNSVFALDAGICQP